MPAPKASALSAIDHYYRNLGKIRVKKFREINIQVKNLHRIRTSYENFSRQVGHRQARGTLAWRNVKEFAAFVATMYIKKYGR